ncbi:hypothetical protein V8D89_008582 [Ganoderma adspersum]
MDPSSTGSTLSPSSRFPGSFPLNSTFGAALLGTHFSLILYGVLAHQTMRYYRTYPDDTLWLKALLTKCCPARYYLWCPWKVFIAPYASVFGSPGVVIELMLHKKGATIVLSQAFVPPSFVPGHVNEARMFIDFSFIELGHQFRGWAIFVSRTKAILLLGEFASTIDSSITPAQSSGLFADSWIVAVAAALAVAADWILTDRVKKASAFVLLGSKIEAEVTIDLFAV